MTSKKVQKGVGRTEEIVPETTLITSGELVSQGEPFRFPPGADFDVIGGLPRTLFCPFATKIPFSRGAFQHAIKAYLAKHEQKPTFPLSWK